MEASWKRLGAVLEASWAVLGRESWPTWLQVASQNEAEIDKKPIPKSINFLMPVGIDFWEGFNGFGIPKWSHVDIKTGVEIDIYVEGRIPTKR